MNKRTDGPQSDQWQRAQIRASEILGNLIHYRNGGEYETEDLLLLARELDGGRCEVETEMAQGRTIRCTQPAGHQSLHVAPLPKSDDPFRE